MNTKLLQYSIAAGFMCGLLFLLSKQSHAQKSSAKKMHIRDFGAKGNGKFNNTDAFQKASAYMQANGGTLIIDPGIYILGRQRQTNSFTAGASFVADSLLFLRNAKYPIVISGYGATLKAADGLKFGSFNPVTGEKDSVRKEGVRSSYYASAFTLINVLNCESVTIKGLTLDGNSGNLDIGPAFDKEGIQLGALGIGLNGNKNINIEDCNIHHCALDAIYIAWTGLKDSDPLYPHTLKNVKAKYSGRQGLSWVGGNSLTVINSEFSSTGKAINNGNPVMSRPGAGIDIETENSIIKNGNFTNCVVNDNAGPGVLSAGDKTRNINFSRVTFIGTTNSAAYPKSEDFYFKNCTFVGKVERIYGSLDKTKAIGFKDCLFTMDKKKSPSGKVFGDLWEFYEGDNVIFENCVFDAVDKRLPLFSKREITFVNCSFSQNSSEDFKAAAIFKGFTKFNIKGSGKLIGDESQIGGTVLYNGKQVENLRFLPKP